MPFAPLPADVDALLRELVAPLRLVAHLILVYNVSRLVTYGLDATWPGTRYNREAVWMGAALHDVGKVVHPEELVHPGHAHEAAGVALLRAHGYPDTLARYARTHSQWESERTPEPEDLLITLADTWWRGKRWEGLEEHVCRWIAQEAQAPFWEVFAALDDLATTITADADLRLRWQQRFAATRGISATGDCTESLE